MTERTAELARAISTCPRLDKGQGTFFLSYGTTVLRCNAFVPNEHVEHAHISHHENRSDLSQQEGVGYRHLTQNESQHSEYARKFEETVAKTPLLQLSLLHGGAGQGVSIRTLIRAEVTKSSSKLPTRGHRKLRCLGDVCMMNVHTLQQSTLDCCVTTQMDFRSNLLDVRYCRIMHEPCFMPHGMSNLGSNRQAACRPAPRDLPNAS